jgi:hypothetical protein
MIIGTLAKFPAAVSFDGKSLTNSPSTTGCHLCEAELAFENQSREGLNLRPNTTWERRVCCHCANHSDENVRRGVLDAGEDISTACASGIC